MKEIINLLTALFFLMSVSAQDNTIENLCNKINQDSLRQNVIELQEFSTRYAYSPNRKQVAEY